MADYYTVGQLAYKLGLSEEEVTDLLAKAPFFPRVKDGRKYSRHNKPTSFEQLSNWRANRE